MEVYSLLNNPHLCSLHFDPDDTITKAVIKYLKHGSLPIIPAAVVQDDSSVRYASKNYIIIILYNFLFLIASV